MNISIKTIGNKSIAVIVSAFAAGAGATLVSFAAIPNSQTNIISGCYKNSTGMVKVVDTQSGATCASGETALNWSGQTTGNVMVNNLHDTTLTDEFFYGINFAGVNFQNSDLRSTVFNGSVLTGANFSGANMNGMSMEHVNADGAKLNNAKDISIGGGVSLRNADLTGATIASIYGGTTGGNDSKNADLRGAIFSNTTFSTVQGSGSIFYTNLSGVDLRNLIATNTNQQLTFQGDDLSNTNLSNVTINAIPNGIFFNSDNMAGVNLANAQLHNVTFTNTDLSTALITGTTWDNVTCPDGTNSNDNANTCVGHLHP